MILEYCSVTYGWIGRGLTQEIDWLHIGGEPATGWQGKYWTDFLNYMGQEQWELVAVVPLDSSRLSSPGIAAYFKRPVQSDGTATSST